MTEREVILPPPKEAPEYRQPNPEEAREQLTRVSLAQVPDAVILELRGLLEFRCRKTPGECFCGVHKL